MSDRPAEDDLLGDLDSRERAFVLAYLENGGNGARAAITAGYLSEDQAIEDAASQGAKLLQRMDIAGALSLRSLAVRALAHEILTPELIMQRLDAGFERGLANRQINAAVRAVELQGKQLGMFETRIRVTEESRLIDGELIERLVVTDPGLKPRLLALLPAVDGFDKDE